MKILGETKQNGIPNPENPIEIKSKEICELYEENADLTIKIMDLINKIKELEKNYISKKTILNKIEELKKEKSYYYSDWKLEELDVEIDLLNELIGSDKNG